MTCWRSECRNGCYYSNLCKPAEQEPECCASGSCEVCQPWRFSEWSWSR